MSELIETSFLIFKFFFLLKAARYKVSDVFFRPADINP